jgi:hypothetical protein
MGLRAGRGGANAASKRRVEVWKLLAARGAKEVIESDRIAGAKFREAIVFSMGTSVHVS